MHVDHWQGSSDPEDKTGVSTFKVDGKDYTINLATFSDHMFICRLLEASFYSGMRTAKNLVINSVTETLDRVRVSSR